MSSTQQNIEVRQFFRQFRRRKSMPDKELDEQSTKDEVDAYVEQVVKEVAEETSEESKDDSLKDDARITSEHADNLTNVTEHKETPAEEPSGSEKTAEQGEETGDTEKSWLDDDVKAEVAAYGIGESQLAEFASRQELDRALRLFDTSAIEAGRKALAESQVAADDGQTRNEKGQFAKKDPPDVPPPKEGQKPEGQFEIALDKEVYDEGLVGELTRMRDHYEGRLGTLESRLLAAEASFTEAESLAEEQRFDAAIDALKMPKLFGTTGKESTEELKRREDVLAQAKVLQAGFRTFGRDVEVDALVGRVAPMVFSSEFDKQKLKNQTRKISKQSNGRQGGGATRPQEPREDPRDEFDRLYRELEGRA